MRPLLHKGPTRRTTEFYLRSPENLLLVKEEREGGVLVCSTADNLSTEQRMAFVCYLCVEGFVSGVCESADWCLESFPTREIQPVRWIIDPSWPLPDPVYVKYLPRLCGCIAGTMMV